MTTSHDFSRAPSAVDGSWYVEGIDYDSNGNVYIAGDFNAGQNSTTVDFGCGVLTNVANSLDDAFVAKFDNNGNCQWQKKWGDPSTPNSDRQEYQAQDLVVTPEGNIAVAYTVTTIGPFGFKSAGSRVLELSQGGSLVWSDFLTQYEGFSWLVESIDAGDSSLVAVGSYDVGDPFSSVEFGSSQLPDQVANGNGMDAMAVAWEDLANGNRSRNWGEVWGGSGDNYANDVSVHDSSGDIAVVGNYQGGSHSHVNGTAAPTPTNTSFFIQTLDNSGSYLDALASPAATSGTGDTESISAVDFAANGRVYIAGSYHEKLEAGCNPGTSTSSVLMPNYVGQANACPKAADNSDEDTNYFIIGYTGATNLGTDAWVNYSILDATNTSSPTVRTEQIRELSASNSHVAAVGRAYDPTIESGGGEYGFAHVFDFTGLYPPFPRAPHGSSPDMSNYNQSYIFAGESFTADVVAHDSSGNLYVGGLGSKQNYSLGGSVLPGGSGFLASYTF